MSRLGIDVGTTSIKCTLLTNSNTPLPCVLHAKRVHHADTIAENNQHEQSVQCIVQAIWSALRDLARQSGKSELEVETVSLCCQMHGIVLWNDENDMSNLITWQDHRCSDEFVDEIRRFSQFGNDLHTGYGCATLAWLARECPGTLANFKHCGTIADFFVFVLCGLQSSVISDHNAQSWGFFDEQSRSWDERALSQSCVFIKLPKIVKSGTQIGVVTHEKCMIQTGAQVFVPVGDLQASVYSVLSNNPGRVFNYGTASQVVYTTDPADFETLPASVRRTLYTDSYNLVTAASLNGGNALQVVYKLFSSLNSDLDYNAVMELAYAKRNTTLKVNPVFFGERHDTNTFGGFSNITPDNFTVGDISAAVFRGIVDNLCFMMADVSKSCETLYAVGVADRPILQHFLREKLGDFVLYDKEITAAYGAILFDVDNETV